MIIEPEQNKRLAELLRVHRDKKCFPVEPQKFDSVGQELMHSSEIQGSYDIDSDHLYAPARGDSGAFTGRFGYLGGPTDDDIVIVFRPKPPRTDHYVWFSSKSGKNGA